jgi:hypothetical protein
VLLTGQMPPKKPPPPPHHGPPHGPHHGPHHGPPHHGPHHGPPHHKRHVATSAVAAFINADEVDALLAPWVPDRHDRRFIVRCLIDEGPAHHRGANYILLLLLGAIAARTGTIRPEALSPVPMRLPPHLEDERDDVASYPLGLDESALEAVLGAAGRDRDAMIDCLTDGPPQHVVANIAMVNLLAAIARSLEARP